VPEVPAERRGLAVDIGVLEVALNTMLGADGDLNLAGRHVEQLARDLGVIGRELRHGVTDRGAEHGGIGQCLRALGPRKHIDNAGGHRSDALRGIDQPGIE